MMAGCSSTLIVSLTASTDERGLWWWPPVFFSQKVSAYVVPNQWREKVEARPSHPKIQRSRQGSQSINLGTTRGSRKNPTALARLVPYSRRGKRAFPHQKVVHRTLNSHYIVPSFTSGVSRRGQEDRNEQRREASSRMKWY